MAKFLKIASLVFLFIIHLRFPANNSIIQTLRSRYDNRVVKLVRELETLDYKTRKCKLDLEFLNLCVENNVIPKFIQFLVANKELRNSVPYKKCLNKLLQQEVIIKKQRYRLLEKDLKLVKDELLLSINLFDYNHVCNLFPVKNGKSSRSHQKIHSKKLLALTKGINNVGHDPKTVIFNFSKYKLIKHEESLLSKGLQFAIPPIEVEVHSVVFSLISRVLFL